MQFKQTVLSTIILMFFCADIFAQTNYLPLGDPQEIILNRLDIKLKNDSVLKFSKLKPFSREGYATQLAKIYNDENNHLSMSDKKDIYSVLQKNIDKLSFISLLDFQKKCL